MCTSKPKVKTTDPAPTVITAADSQSSGQTAAARKRNNLRMDLNNSFYQGLAIPNG